MLKIAPNAIVKPKIFWPTIFVLLITCIILYNLKEREKTLRIFTEGELNQTIEMKKVIEGKLIATTKAKEAVEKELGKKKHQMKLILNRLKREITTRHQAEARLKMVVAGKKILEEKVKQLSATSKTIELEKIIVKPTFELTGKILRVNKEFMFVIVDLGSSSNLKVGDVLSIYQDNEFVGKAQVARVGENVSAATILPEWKGIEFKEDNVVKKL